MEVSIHYIVKAKLIRFIEDGNIDFIEINEKFVNTNPIIAREQAFDFYQNYIDVLLQGINKTYVSDKQTREDIISFVDSGIITKIEGISKGFPNSYGNGIGVYLVIDNPIEDEIYNDIIGDEYLIHGIQYGGTSAQSFMDGLNHEYWYYNYFGYDFKNYKETINFYDADGDITEPNDILKTPFDWTGYDVYLTNEELDEEGDISAHDTKTSITYEELIQGGETNQVEFKPSLLYYYDKVGNTSGYRMFVRHIIAKVICSFLNSNGGFLFIGVGDDKTINGLQDDYSLAQPKGKDHRDYFSLQIDKLIRDYFKGISGNINGEFVTIDEKEIFVITVFPSKTYPIFINGQSGKEFYVRLTTSCEPYTDIEDIAKYCIDKWGK
ncbi:ATP-binding protein [Flavobacterium sp.]|uniref:AlbA family DNA-binding domain-containing protein n=1 Tax=Flavobacterium sp. TaxID=239 RepID=UPI00262C1B36|nr:ATP-binding protein [Flavobacterium sp.]MDD2986413.1 ATP-binding protein [Flavobacterium sp.]